LTGETVIVTPRVSAGTDERNHELWTDGEPVMVPNVLVEPGQAQDIADLVRPEGVEVRYTLRFPKAFAGDLRGATVQLPGEPLPMKVVGDPRRWPERDCPTRWNLTVGVAASDG